MSDLNGSFNCDYQVEKQIDKLFKLFNIKCCLETGTYTGNTSIWFSNRVDDVYTVELTDKWYNFSRKKFMKQNISNINIFRNHSVNFLKNNLFKIKEKYSKIICYLDAHWEDDWPLNNEIIEIAKVYKDNAIIIIDDFKVPNRNFQFDSYKREACDLAFVQNALSNLGNYIYYYNNSAENYHPSLRPNCIGVGKLYVIPKKMLVDSNVDENELYIRENNINYSKII